MGNTRADRYANGGEEARDALLKGSAVEAGVKSLGNIGDFQEKAEVVSDAKDWVSDKADQAGDAISCLLYTSPSPRDGLLSRMPSSA